MQRIYYFMLSDYRKSMGKEAITPVNYHIRVVYPGICIPYE